MFLRRLLSFGKEPLGRAKIILQLLIFLEKLKILVAQVLGIARFSKSLFRLSKSIC